jgi:nicotinate dehydrogenase subunit B
VDARVSEAAEVQLAQALIVADAGLVIDPDGLANQLEGGFVQAASWTLVEEVRWDADGVTSIDWESYPILRFGDVPPITTYLISRPHEPALGAGEASTGPTPAAIANAVFAATGIRARRVPLTPENLRRAAAQG